jgi:hypothetical protein
MMFYQSRIKCSQLYPNKLQIKDITESDISAFDLDILLNINSNARLMTMLYDKRDEINFVIVNVPFLCSYISLSPVYVVYIF